jgi:hypothetical protein
MLRLALAATLAATLFAGCDNNAETDKPQGVDDTAAGHPGDEDGDGFTASEGDCDETNAEVNPAATELCNGLDDNCNDLIDEDVQNTYYQDFDEDGFGNIDVELQACEPPSGYVQNATDCDDVEADAYPGATEVCDEIDNDCDGQIDEDVAGTYYADADSDGYGDPSSATLACEMPDGMVTDNTDCDDSTNHSYPGNAEVCDELDNNCDGTVDEGVTTTYYADFDSDGYGAADLTQEACSTPTGYTRDDTDCDDAVAAVNPAATEVCNSVDDDCDGTVDENTASDASTWYADSDGDGYGDLSVSTRACTQPAGYVASSTDCDDGRALTNPAATEYCNTYDDDCDGTVDESAAADATTWYLDADSDRYGNASVSQVACTQPAGYVADDTDCNDGTSRANPGATEYCDYIDNNCDGTVDENTAADATTWYADTDSDRFGDTSVSQVSCTQPAGYVADNTDCLDSRAASYPGAPEYCNGYDDDCDGTVDENSALDATTWHADSDGDLYGNSAVTSVSCTAPAGYVADATDCDDGRALTNPGATEYCNSIDDDCDGTVDEDASADASTWYRDSDRDGYGDATVSDVGCAAPAGYVADDTDCLDSSAISYPGATEICDGLDNDCDGTVDDNPTDGDTYYRDSDADGFGDVSSTDVECGLPSGYADNYWDCNDSDRTEPVVADATLGSPAGSGTLTSPYDSIQDAIDAANECVVVYSGTYLEQVDLSGKSIDVWGVEGSDITTIDANLSTCGATNPTACGATVTVADGVNAVPTIHGFTITGGTGAYTSSTMSTTCADSSASHSGRTTCTVNTYIYCGGGVYVNGDDPAFYDVIIRDNVLPAFEQTAVSSFTQNWLYSNGGGVCLMNSNATFETTMIEGNSADQGGGIYAESGTSFTFAEGEIAENDATDGGGVNLTGAASTFTNAIIACNTADTDGGGLYTERSGTSNFTNTVLYGNASSTSGSSRGSQAYIGTSTTFNLYNSIVQSATTVYAIYGAGGTGTQSYNNVYNTPGSSYGGTLSAGSGAVSSGNNFTSSTCDGNPYNDNFALRSTSGSINTGNPSASYNDADGTQNDQGAYGGPNSTWDF